MTDREIDIAKRRTLLGGAAALLSACGPMPPSARGQHEAIRHLQESGIEFRDGNGQLVNLNAIQEKLYNNPYTLSFQFAACGDTCPIIGAAIGEVGKRPQYANVKHIIISTAPFFDINRSTPSGPTALEQALMARTTGLRPRGPNANTLILYPSVNGRMDDINTELGTLQTRYFDLAADTKNPSIGHTSTVIVYDGNGKKHGQIDRPYDVVNKLPPMLDTILQQGQVR